MHPTVGQPGKVRAGHGSHHGRPRGPQRGPPTTPPHCSHHATCCTGQSAPTAADTRPCHPPRRQRVGRATLVPLTPAPPPRTRPVGGNSRGGCGRSGGTDARHRLPRRPMSGAVILPAAACAAPWRGRRSAADAPRRRQPIPVSHSFETTHPLVMAILPDRESFGHSCVVHASQTSFQAEHVPQFPTSLLARPTEQPLLSKHCGHAHRQGREAVGREVVGGWPRGGGE